MNHRNALQLAEIECMSYHIGLLHASNLVILLGHTVGVQALCMVHGHKDQPRHWRITGLCVCRCAPMYGSARPHMRTAARRCAACVRQQPSRVLETLYARPLHFEAPRHYHGLASVTGRSSLGARRLHARKPLQQFSDFDLKNKISPT